ncbi:MAG: hypothetical protein FLDDKLPJ_01677 [Phycisphaerae bacterium]|nr:hypothetical protein [Phycisphaerae bacterium]
MLRNGRNWLAAVAVMAFAGSVMATEIALEDTTPIWPTHIAKVIAPGVRGPWVEYQIPEVQPVALGPVWDSYEADPTTWNNVDNIACEYYTPYCLGQCDGRRYRWCNQNCDGTDNDFFRNKRIGTGGATAASPPNQITVATFIWGSRENLPAEEFQYELLVFDTYDGTGCTDAGSNFMGGVVLSFAAPINPGFYRTTADLTGGFEIPSPGTGRIAIQSGFYADYDNDIYSTHKYSGLWFTKEGYENQMGNQDDLGFDDFAAGNNDGVLDAGECIFSAPVCGNNILVGAAILLLGEGGGGGPCNSDGCNGNESLKASARAKGCGCQVKGVLKNATPGAVYGIQLPSGQCVTTAANNRGKAKAKECPSVSGNVSVPTCGLSRAVNCP